MTQPADPSASPPGSAAQLRIAAANCWRELGHHEQAAECFQRAGAYVRAGAEWVEAGQHERAAEAYRQAGKLTESVDSYCRAGRFNDAAYLLSHAGDPLGAAWLVLTRVQPPSRQWAETLLRRVEPRDDPQLLLAAIARGLFSSLWDAEPGLLTGVLEEVELRFPELHSATGRREIRDRAVEAAQAIQRPDLAARMYAAAYRAGVGGTAGLWRAWADEALGGTAGVPEQDAHLEPGSMAAG